MREKTKKTFKLVLENAKMFKFSKQTMKISTVMFDQRTRYVKNKHRTRTSDKTHIRQLSDLGTWKYDVTHPKNMNISRNTQMVTV